LATEGCGPWNGAIRIAFEGGSRGCRQLAGENNVLKNFLSVSSIIASIQNILSQNGTYTFYEEKH